MQSPPAILEFGGFRLNPAERSLTAGDGTPVQLTRRLYDTLLYMVERPGRLLEKQALMDAVWQGAVVEENTLSRTISNLRSLLGERGGEHRCIETVSGLGYRFIQVVTVRAPAMDAAPERDELAIAVLPFEDLSRDCDQGYFADGIAEEVLNRLASVTGLRVIAKGSSFGLRDRKQSAPTIGRALGVDYLLGGSVRKEGHALRITAQLVEAATDSQRWSERFDRTAELESIFATQDDIARAVTHALRAKLGLGEPTPTYRSTSNMEAYDLFLRGRALFQQSGAHGTLRSAELFRAATQRDPSFAPAWLWLTHALRSRLVFAPEHAAEAMAELESAGARVLELAPHWSAAHLVQLWRHLTRRDWLAMEQVLNRARELGSPVAGELDFSFGNLHAQVNDSQAAIEHYRAAAANDPLSLLISALLQKELIIAGRYAEADAEYRRGLDLAGDREMAEHLVLHALWARGEPFREQFRRYLDLATSRPTPVLDRVYPVCEDPPRALETLHTAAAAPESQTGPQQLQLAWWMAAYGDVEGAFATMWHGYVDLNFAVVNWLWLPVFARVREHARFPELLERVGLVAYWRAKNRGGPADAR